MRGGLLWVVVVAVGLVAGPAVWAEAAPAGKESASVLLEKGIYLEETAGDLDAAIATYRQVIEQAQANRRFAGEAQYRLGACLLKKGKDTEAIAALQKVVDLYPEQKSLVERARGQIRQARQGLGGEAVAKVVQDAVTTISNCAEGDPKVAQALATLDGLDEQAVVAQLANYLDSDVANMRRSAVYILWKGGFASIEPAVPGLTRLLSHEEEFTRGMAAITLGANRAEPSFDAITKMTLEDRSGYARRCAAYALGLMGDPKAEPTLAKALKDPDAMVRANAQAASQMLATSASSKPAGGNGAGDPAVDVAKAWLEAVEAGQFERALGLSRPGELEPDNLRKMNETVDFSRMRLTQAFRAAQAAAALFGPFTDKQGAKPPADIGLSLLRQGDRWIVRDLDFLPTAEAREKWLTEFRAAYPDGKPVGSASAASQPTATQKAAASEVVGTCLTTTTEEFLKDVAAGKVDSALALAAPGAIEAQRLQELAQRLDISKMRSAQVWSGRTLGCVVFGNIRDKQDGKDTGVGVGVVLQDGQCRVREVELLPAWQDVRRFETPYRQDVEKSRAGTDGMTAAAKPGLKILPAPWADGEEMRLDVQTKLGMDIGTMIYTARQVRPEPRAPATGSATQPSAAEASRGRRVPADTAGQPPESLWRIESYMAVPIADSRQYTRVDARLDSFEPASAVTKNQLGTFEAAYTRGKQVLLTATQKGQSSMKIIDVTGPVFDNEQALYLIRRLPLADGYEGSFSIFPVVSGAVTTCKVRVEGRETVQWAKGPSECFHVRLEVMDMGIAALRHQLWISTDPRRALVKYDADQAVLVLQDVGRIATEPVKWQAADNVWLTRPVGWQFMRSASPSPYRLMVSILPPEMTAWALFTAAELPMDIPARAVAEGDVETLKGFFKDYTVRPDSWQDRQVSGIPGVSYVADYKDESGEMVEYRAYFTGPGTVYWFVFRVDKEAFAAAKSGYDTLIQGLQAPRPTETQKAAASRSAVAEPGSREELTRLAQEAFEQKSYAVAEKYLQKLVVLDPMSHARSRLQEAAVLAHPERYEGVDLSSPESVVRGFTQAAAAGDTTRAMKYVLPYGIDYEDIQAILTGRRPGFEQVTAMFAATDPVNPVESVAVESKTGATARAKWRVRFAKPWTIAEKGQQMTLKPGETFELDGDLKQVAGRWLIDGI